ncbi:hypothetical protein GCM10009850_072300 [Nonomuraea monospora]|uniref:Uncharacterized protein n=1 Tax=Nonomuraea monospora TaxID=568818 RepID=A0ABN3CQZ9_9ACTN
MSARSGLCLESSRQEGEPPMAIDVQRIRANGRLLIVPYNSVRYLALREEHDRLLDCWPILERQL